MRWQSLIGGAIGLGLPTLTAAVGNNGLRLPPYDFLMGNHADSPMENKLQKDGSLKGRLYVYFTGEADEAPGLPVARHPRGAREHSEECGVDPIECVVGWQVRAVPADRTESDPGVAFMHGGEKIAVSPGVDNSTH